jgi:hypothetical protein
MFITVGQPLLNENDAIVLLEKKTYDRFYWLGQKVYDALANAESPS